MTDKTRVLISAISILFYGVCDILKQSNFKAFLKPLVTISANMRRCFLKTKHEVKGCYGERGSCSENCL